MNTSAPPPEPDPEDHCDGTDADQATTDPGPDRHSVQRERFRTVLGWTAAVAGIAVALFYALAAPGPEQAPGARGVALRWGVPAMWVLLALTVTTWTLRAREQLTRTLSFVVVAMFVFYMVLRAV